MLLKRLPMSSAYHEAILNDPDLAEVLADHPPQGKPRPLLREFNAETALLTAVVDRLTEVATGIAALGGAKTTRSEQLPRPETAVDRLTQMRSVQALDSLLADVEAAQERWTLEHPAEADPPSDSRSAGGDR